LSVQVTITAYPVAMGLHEVGLVFDDGISCSIWAGVAC
jgi:hypothetical protein